MNTFHFHGKNILLTPAFREVANEENLTEGAVFACLSKMEEEGVFEDFLTPTNQLGKDAALEIVRRRDAYQAEWWINKVNSVLVSLMAMLTKLLECREYFTEKLTQEHRRLMAVVEQIGVTDLSSFKEKGLEVLEEEVREFVLMVEEKVLEVNLQNWSSVCRAHGVSNRARKLVRRHLKENLQRRGLSAVLERLDFIIQILHAGEKGPSASSRITAFVTEGKIPSSLNPEMPQVLSFSRGPNRVDHKIVNMDVGRKNGVHAHEEEVLDEVPERETEVMQVTFILVGYRKGGMMLLEAEVDGESIRLDRSSDQPTPGMLCNCEVMKRASDGNTYVRFIGYAEEANEVSAS